MGKISDEALLIIALNEFLFIGIFWSTQGQNVLAVIGMIANGLLLLTSLSKSR